MQYHNRKIFPLTINIHSQNVMDQGKQRAISFLVLNQIKKQLCINFVSNYSTIDASTFIKLICQALLKHDTEAALSQWCLSKMCKIAVLTEHLAHT